MTIYPVTPSSGLKLTEDKWHHVALVYNINAEQQDIYINGHLDSSTSQGLYSTANNPFFIGSVNGTGQYFIGELDHLSITGRAKTPCEILQDASWVASYSFTQGGSAAQDSGPNGFNGFISGTVDSDNNGAVGDALVFTGSSDYFQVTAFEIWWVENLNKYFQRCWIDCFSI